MAIEIEISLLINREISILIAINLDRDLEIQIEISVINPITISIAIDLDRDLEVYHDRD